jgi:hypothetical protein
MTFKFTVNQNPLTIEFDAESIAEGAKVLIDNSGELARLYGEFRPGADSATEESAPKTRKSRKGQPDATTAVAPAPIPVPGAIPAPPAAVPPAPPTPAPANNGTDGLEIPPFLKRDAAAPPPPPPAPAAPVPPPAAARLADKVIANLKKRAAGAADGGQQLADWLAQYNIVVKGATFDEALAVIQFFDDNKIADVAKALEVQ